MRRKYGVRRTNWPCVLGKVSWKWRRQLGVGRSTSACESPVKVPVCLSHCTLWSGQLASVRLGVELGKEFCEMLTSGHDKAAAVTNT